MAPRISWPIRALSWVILACCALALYLIVRNLLGGEPTDARESWYALASVVGLSWLAFYGAKGKPPRWMSGLDRSFDQTPAKSESPDAAETRNVTARVVAIATLGLGVYFFARFKGLLDSEHRNFNLGVLMLGWLIISLMIALPSRKSSRASKQSDDQQQ